MKVTPLNSRYAIITGGSKGIGEAIALDLLGRHIKVISLDKETPTNEHLRHSQDFLHMHCDLNDMDMLNSVIQKIMDQTKQIDYLINNAAIQYEGSIESVTLSQWDEVMNVNLKVPFFLIQNLLPLFSNDSRILNISSVHGENPRRDKFSYDASKAGLNMLTKSLALSLSERNIKVNALAIGATRTPMNRMFEDKNGHQKAIGKIPLGRVSEPEEIARFAVSLLSKDNTYMTGSIVYFDGGRHLN